jgi:sigma-B regulation protein RsbU (phosphoserine phosphatase)
MTARGNVVDRVMGLDAGADEFLSKPLEMNELKARVRAGLRLYQIKQDLQARTAALEAGLAEASAYVLSLLPPPLVGGINTEVLFVPSKQLGGDCFDYYWLDNENLVIYLLDVAGHGVGSALLSVSVLNILRSQSLTNADFSQPSTVLKALNNSFQMSEHSDKYFTIWYGVFNILKRKLTYANAGHPPALLLTDESAAKKQARRLVSTDLPIGFSSNVEFDDSYCDVDESSTLYVFSDGMYEICCSNGATLGINTFIDLLVEFSQDKNFYLEMLLKNLIKLNARENFTDDLSLLKVTFN